jgi:hypothetical protein
MLQWCTSWHPGQSRQRESASNSTISTGSDRPSLDVYSSPSLHPTSTFASRPANATQTSRAQRTQCGTWTRAPSRPDPEQYRSSIPKCRVWVVGTYGSHEWELVVPGRKSQTLVILLPGSALNNYMILFNIVLL